MAEALQRDIPNITLHVSMFQGSFEGWREIELLAQTGLQQGIYPGALGPCIFFFFLRHLSSGKFLLKRARKNGRCRHEDSRTPRKRLGN